MPEMCEAAGFKCKTAYSLCVTRVSSLFNDRVEEKLILERSGHPSNALFQYKKPMEENVFKVSKILGTSVSAVSCSTTEKQDESLVFKDVVFQNVKFKTVQLIICCPIVVVGNDWSGKYTVFSIKTDKFQVSGSMSWSVFELIECLDRYVHWVSKYMHLTQLMQADWVISTWIIDEFEKKR